MDVAVLLPCHNEEQAIAGVIAQFRAALPQASIYVYDNASTDRTAEVAAASGAIVRREPLRGKGNVIRRMFADIDADIYVLSDGDDTYHAPSAPAMIETLVSGNLDMVIGSRGDAAAGAYRRGHEFGNRLLTGSVALIFGNRCRDMLSGYRILSRRFVKSFPALSRRFETETEMTIHALALRLPMAEIDAPYGARAEGTASKLSTFRDGLHIGATIVQLFKDERPLLFFLSIFAVLAALSVILAIPVVITYLETGLVPRLPTALLSTGLMLLAFICLAIGIILDAVTRARRETKRLAYLTHAAPLATRPRSGVA